MAAALSQMLVTSPVADQGDRCHPDSMLGTNAWRSTSAVTRPRPRSTPSRWRMHA